MGFPEGAVIEIVERTNDPDPKVIIPNEVRINGQRLLCTDSDPITVESISTLGRGLVRVNITLVARRVTIGAEPKEES